MTHDHLPAAPLRHPIRVEAIRPRGGDVVVRAEAEQLPAIAAQLGLVSIESLEARYTLSRNGERVKLDGRIAARLHQACVVTLDPVESHIDEPVEVVFVPEGSKLARLPLASESGEMLLDPDGPDAPEIFSGDSIDAGEVAAEHVALAIDPYPRKADTGFAGHIESTDKDDRKPSPFAVLKDWKKD